MKTVYLLVFVFFFASCQKEHCWECKTVYSNGESDMREFCDMTQSEFRDFEKEQFKDKRFISSYDCKKK